MEIILLEKVQNLGDLGEKVRVKPGYGRNYLVPQGKAVPATKDNIEMFESRRAELEAAAQERFASAQARCETMQEVAVEIIANASEEGKLYGSIGPREIAIAVSEAGYPLEKSEVIMGEGPIRNTGEFDVLIQLYAEVETTVKVRVIAE
jgi:large subunit ribosomal protein L9